MSATAIMGHAIILGATLIAREGVQVEDEVPHCEYCFECVAPDGTVRWRDSFRNVVTTQGRNFALDTFLRGSAYTAAWYLLLAAAGSKVAADTLAAHPGWFELAPYAGNRKAVSFPSAAANAANQSTPVAIAITADATISGAGLTNAASGTSGVLYSAGDFSSQRPVKALDTLNVTVNVSWAA